MGFLGAGEEFKKGDTPEIVEPGTSEASHTYRRTLLKTVSWVLNLEQQLFSYSQYLENQWILHLFAKIIQK